MHIFFAVTDFDMGGITVSLDNLSRELIRQGHDVSVLNLPNAKETSNFHEKVQIIPLPRKCRYWNVGITDYLNAHGARKLKLLLFGAFKKLLARFDLWEKFIFSGLPIIDCDVAVAYRQSAICYYICTRKTTARSTIAFIHSEFTGDCSSWLPKLNDMDKIACVSNDWSNRFKERFPDLSQKVYTVYNLFDAEKLKKMAEEVQLPEMQKAKFNIVTSARIDFQPKRLNLIPLICQKLLQNNVTDFTWYIIGDGPDREKLEQLIDESGTRSHILMLGAKKNPYSYVKNAELFVLISEWESYGMVIQEAMILGTPILASDYPALHEIMDDGVYGVITQSDVDSIAEGIERLYHDEKLYRQLKSNCQQYCYSPDTGYNQFIGLCK